MLSESSLPQQLAAAQDLIQQLSEQLAAEREAVQQLEQQINHQQTNLAHREAQNQRLQRVLETSPATTYSHQATPPYACTYISQGIEAVLGYTPSEFTATPDFCVQLIHPDDVAEVFAQISGLFEQGKLQCDYRMRHRDGHYIWIHDDRVLLRDAAGMPQEVVGYFTDISARKAAEAIVQQQTEREMLLRDITQRIRQTLDLDAVLNTAVDQVRQFFKVDRAVVYRFLPDWSGDFVAESVAEPWVKLLHPEIRQVLTDTCLQEKKGSRFQNQETLAVSNIYQAGFQPCHIELLEQFQAKALAIVPIFAGETLWGLLAVYQNSDFRPWLEGEINLLQQIGSQLGMGIYQASLHEQVQTELQQRQRAEAVLRQQLGAIESAVDGIATLQNDRYVYLNSAHVKLFGYETAEELIGQSWTILYSPEMLAQIEQTVFPTLQKQRYWQGELVATHKDGTTFPEFVSLTLLDDNVLVCVCRDITAQKQIEDQLQKVQDQMMAILNELPAVVYTKDLLGRHTFVNKAFVDLFGCERSDIIGRINHEFFDAETAARLQENDDALIAQGILPPFEETVLFVDTPKTFLSHKFLLCYEDGQPYALCGISTDISERKQTELELQAQKKLIESAIQTNPDLLVYLFDVPSQSLLFVSDSVANILDYTAAEILAMGADLVPNLVHPDDHLGFAAYIDQLDQSPEGTSLTFEYRVRHRDGRWLDLLLRGQAYTRDEQGHIQQFLGSVVDITSRKRTEANLQASEARFEMIANLVPDFLWESDPDSFNTWCNQRWLDYTGQTLEQALGRGWLEAIHPGDRATSVLIQRESAEMGEPRREERRIRRHDGEYRWFVSNIAPIKNAEGEVIKMYGAVTDIHEGRMALEASQAAAEIDAFRVRLSDVLRSLTNPIHIQAEACHLLGEQLGVDRVFYSEINEIEGYAQINHEYTQAGLPSLLGRYSLADYGASLPYLRQGETVIVADTQTAVFVPERDRVALANLGLVGMLSLPLIKDGRLVGAFTANTTTPHDWTAAEVDLVRETAERLWTTMQRAEAEAAVKDLSERLALALQAGSIGTWDWDCVNEVNWDGQMYVLYGMQNLRERAVYPTWRDSLHPDDRDRVEALLHAALRGEADYNTEFRILRPNGELRWIQAVAQVQTDPHGNPKRMVGINQDITDRKNAEAALRRQTNRLTLALQAGGFGAGEWDFVNPPDWDEQVYKIYGLQDLGRPATYQDWRDLLHPDDASQVEATLAQAPQAQGILTAEFRIVRLDGQLRWVQAFAQTERDAAGTPLRMVSITQDITDRKQAELALQEQTNRLKLALRAGSYGIWEWDLVNDPIWDDRIYEDYGLQDLGRPLTYQDWCNHIHPDDRPWVEAQLEADLRARIPFSAEFRICRPDGELRWVLSIAKLYCDGQGQPMRMVGIHQDITHRKLAEQEICNSQAKFQRLVDDIGDKFVVFSIAGGTLFTYVSGGFQSVFGVPPEAVLGRHWADTIQWFPESIELAQSEDETLRTGQVSSQEFEMSFVHPDGGIRTIHVVQHPVWDSDDSLLAVEGVVEDITERKAAEAELHRTNAELERATRLKDEFLANMSHELRTPLNAILGMTEGLQEEIFGPLTERQQRSLNTIERSSSHLLSLINDILDLSKIEAGQVDLDFNAISVSLLCSASVTFVKQQAYKKRQQITTLIPDGLPDLYGDDRRLRQVLINLLTNAVKFTPEGGHITLAANYIALAQNDVQAEIFIHPQANLGDTLGLLSISITDTGIGIRPEDAQRLFQPFVQVNTALNRQYEGTGLGLSLVKRLVEMHGGEVTLTSEVGSGSCFTVQLPIIALPNPDGSPAHFTESIKAEAPVDPTEAPLILLAEDNEANLSTSSSYLEAKGYRLVIARNGLEAIDLATTTQPDLILMDIQMPHLDGLEAIRQIRQKPALATVPIITLTALAMPADRERCLEAGANHYLSKPIRLRQLSEIITTLLVQAASPSGRE
ncbi:PAS domain-containing protein [Phormidium sp. FACHB-1136]|uniref:PAS domain-containing protein n=1 Tax=Phormidium sp. FACHB-1136 TaxID=2692848 RepID=UPI0016855126|nr:PAS domain-containing protein [Phormidium sp. FACHB-1136]MBD2429170.1 PAS domain-containing protein [Phormidium sp. FACHB-1136]